MPRVCSVECSNGHKLAYVAHSPLDGEPPWTDDDILSHCSNLVCHMAAEGVIHSFCLACASKTWAVDLLPEVYTTFALAQAEVDRLSNLAGIPNRLTVNAHDTRSTQP